MCAYTDVCVSEYVSVCIYIHTHTHTHTFTHSGTEEDS